MEKNRLDKSCICTMNAASVANELAVAGKRAVEQAEENLERDLDDLIKAGPKADPAAIEAIGKRIYQMRKRDTSARYLNICKKYAKLAVPSQMYYRFAIGVIEYEEKFR